MLDRLIDPISDILDKFIEDKDQKAQLAHEIATMSQKHAQELALAQIEVNKEEAKSSSVFVSGWRPFVGWVCGISLCWHFLGVPVVTAIVTWSGVEMPPLPVFDLDTLTTVLMGMLGLGGLRTFEKLRGVAR